MIEVITDKDGKFTIPSWMTFKPLSANSVMHDNAPEIVIYKPGYKFYYSHKYQRERLPYSVNYSEEERKTFKEKYSINPAKLKRIFTDEEKAKNIIETRDAVKFFMIGEGLSKNDIKLLLKALEEDKLNLSDKFRNALPK